MRLVLSSVALALVAGCSSAPSPARGSSVDEPVGEVAEALKDAGASCTSVSLTASPASPQVAGTSIVFTAAAKCGSATAEYEFHLKASGGAYSTVQSYSTTASWGWLTASEDPGDYEVEVTVHAKGGKGTQAKKAVPYTLEANCGSEPTLHVDPAGTIFCDASGGADGGTLSCSTGDQCCLGGEENGTFEPQECSRWGGKCKNGGGADAGTPALPIACMQVADCAANGDGKAVACCLQGATAPADATGCDYPRSLGGTAVVCESTTCAAGEVQVCSSQADCPAGTTCTAGKWKIYQTGFCL